MSPATESPTEPSFPQIHGSPLRLGMACLVCGCFARPVAGEPPPASELPALLTRYFQQESSAARAETAARIESLENVTVEEVTRAVREVQLWEPRQPGFEEFVLSGDDRRTTRVRVHVPRDYDSRRAYPLLIALHGTNGTGQRYLPFALDLLDDRVHEYVVAAPTAYQGCWIGSTQAESTEPTAMLRELKRRYHIDSDRVYASGYSKGGHASFLLAVLYTDQFAAAVPLAGTFATQVGWELVDIMLPNVRHLPMLVVYGEHDRDDRTDKRDESSGISGSNRFVSRVARRLNVPIQMVELADTGHGGIRPPREAFFETLRSVRPHVLKSFDHWFRYPSQGRLCWLRQKRYQGTPWRGEQLKVTPKQEETLSEATTRVLQRKLAYVGGFIEGQVIDIHTRRCLVVDLLLNDDLVDLDRDITVHLKGKEVFSGPVHPSITTLLDLAHRDWDFQRLFSVRLEITRKGEVRPH